MQRSKKVFCIIVSSCIVFVSIVAIVVFCMADTEDTSNFGMANPPIVLQENACIGYRKSNSIGSNIKNGSYKAPKLLLYSTASEALKNTICYDASSVPTYMNLYYFEIDFSFSKLESLEKLRVTVLSGKNIGAIYRDISQQAGDVWSGSITFKTLVDSWADGMGLVDKGQHMKLKSFIVEVVYESSDGDREHGFMAFQLNR